MKAVKQGISRFRALPHRQAWTLAWPMILSNMSIPLMGFADTAMLGHLESPVFLAAVAIGSNIVALLYWMFAFLRMGTTSASAQAIGANNTSLAVLHLTQNTLLAIALGVGLILLQALLVPFVLWLIAPDQELLSVAKQYCFIRIYSAPAVLVTYVTTGWLIGLKKPKIPLAITVSSNLLNIVLDYIFIVEWQLDAKGAALATLIAEYVACLSSLFFVWRHLQSKGWKLQEWIDLSQLQSTLKVSADLFIRTIALLFVFNFFNAQSAQFGNDVLAANAILMQFVLFVAFFLDGYALAAEAMTAQSIGARNLNQFHKASMVTGVTALGIAFILTGVFAFSGGTVLQLLTDIDAVLEIAKQHFMWLLLMPIISVWCYAFDGIFIGAGQSRAMRNAMLFSVFLGFLPAWWIFRAFGNHGLWLAIVVFNSFRGVSLAIAYYLLTRKNTWLNKPV